MSETEKEEQNQKLKVSKPGIREMVIVVVVCLLMIAILWPVLIRLREYRWRIRCGENLRWLGTAMIVYSCDDCNKSDVCPYPAADKWCDILVEGRYVTEEYLKCPANRKGRCNYALNPSVSPVSDPRSVVLFETAGGWNQSGGVELVTFENHNGDGCNVLFNDSHTEFVNEKEVGGLMW